MKTANIKVQMQCGQTMSATAHIQKTGFRGLIEVAKKYAKQGAKIVYYSDADTEGEQ